MLQMKTTRRCSHGARRLTSCRRAALCVPTAAPAAGVVHLTRSSQLYSSLRAQRLYRHLTAPK